MFLLHPEPLGLPDLPRHHTFDFETSCGCLFWCGYAHACNTGLKSMKSNHGSELLTQMTLLELLIKALKVNDEKNQ